MRAAGSSWTDIIRAAGLKSPLLVEAATKMLERV
jgi:hypothetical protein